jgi:hypothetical protein
MYILLPVNFTFTFTFTVIPQLSLSFILQRKETLTRIKLLKYKTLANFKKNLIAAAF